jgi:hypothetical protein
MPPCLLVDQDADSGIVADVLNPDCPLATDDV